MKAVSERKRTYHYADGSVEGFADVTAVGVTKSGFHKLETIDSNKYIVAPGWRYISLDMDAWSF